MLDSIRRNSQSWVVKVIFALIILTFVFWGANTMTSNSGDVLAEVNGEPIYRNELVQEFNWEMQRMQQTRPDLPTPGRDEQEDIALDILRRMVSKTLLRQEAARLGITASDAELSVYVTSMPMFQDNTGKFSEAIYRDSISILGLTPGSFEKMANDDVLMNKLRNYVGSAIDIDETEARRMFNFELERRVVELIPFTHADYLGKVNPSEAEIITFYSDTKEDWRIPTRVDVEYLNFDVPALAALTPVTDEQVSAYYEKNKEQFTLPERFNARHILIRMPLALGNSDEAVAEAEAKAKKVAEEIRAGKDFAAAVSEYSDDIGTKDKGGDLGWTEKGQLEPAFEEAALALKPGEISDPVRTYYGFHIIETLASRAAEPRSLADASEEIRAQLQEDAAFANLVDTMSAVEDTIITGATLEALAEQYKVEVRDSGLMSPNSITALLELPDDVFVNAAATPAGTIFPTPFEVGKGFIVLRLKEYKATYIPELTEIKDEVTETFKELEAAKLAGNDAEALLKNINEEAGKVPADYEAKVFTANATRFTGIIQLGETPELTHALYLAQPGQWLQKPFVVEGNTVIARIKETLPPEESDWQEMSTQYIQGVNAMRKSDMFNIFLAELHGKAKINSKAEYLLYPN